MGKRNITIALKRAAPPTRGWTASPSARWLITAICGGEFHTISPKVEGAQQSTTYEFWRPISCFYIVLSASFNFSHLMLMNHSLRTDGQPHSLIASARKVEVAQPEVGSAIKPNGLGNARAVLGTWR
jgi:hypothetical protein